MKKGLLKFFISACALCFALAIGCYFFVNNSLVNTYAYNVVIAEGESIDEVYGFGENFTFPQASFDVNGNKIPASEHYLICPDGTIRVGDDVKLTKEGTYKVGYKAIIDGKIYKDETNTFKVYNNPWEYSYDATTVEYKEALDMYYYKNKASVEGLHITLAEGDTWTFNKVVDLREDADVPFLEFSPWACSRDINKTEENPLGRKNDPEIGRITMRLTDCYDVENYIEFNINYYRLRADLYQAYIQVVIPGCDTLGLQKSGSGNINVNGTACTVVRNHKNFGTYSAEAYRLTRGARFYFDYNLQYIWMYDGHEDLPVTDLDDPNIYVNGMFGGFTTGEVIFSITTTQNNDPQANFDIKSIKGYSGQDLATTVVDERNPDLSVNVEEKLIKNGINIVKDEPFKLFDYTCYDVNISSVTAEVYRDYYYENERQIQVVRDGIFTPTRVGSYAIVYTAIDTFGNKTQKIIDMTCIDVDKMMEINFASDFAPSYEIAKTNTLPAYSFTSANDVKNIKLNITITNGVTTYEVDPTSNTFFLEEAGIYDVIYTFKDGITSVTETHKISLVKSDNVYIDRTQLVYPEYFIKNMVYTLDNVDGFTYNTGKPIKKAPDFYVSNDGGSFVKADPNMLKIEANNTVQFKYELKVGDSIDTVLSQQLPVVNDAYDPAGKNFLAQYSKSNYFVGDVTATEEQQYVSLKTNNLGRTEVAFVNYLSLSNFKLAFRIPSGYDNFGSIEIKLIDFYNRDYSASFFFRSNGAGKTLVRVNDSVEETVESNIVTNSNFVVSCSADNILDIAPSFKFKLKDWFTSDRVFMHIIFNNVTDKAGVNIYTICNQDFAQYSSDQGGFIKADRSYRGGFSVGEIAQITAPELADVMNPFTGDKVTLTVTFKDAEGNTRIVEDLNGTRLSFAKSWEMKEKIYKFELKELGTYTVLYNYTDQSGKSASRVQNTIRVADFTAPVFEMYKDGVKVETGETVNIKKGTEYDMPTVQAQDNITPVQNLTVRIVIVLPSFSADVASGTSYRFNMSGKHRISYLVFDDAGNYSIDYFFINVQ